METYEVLFKEGETTGVYGISLVNDPAMESMWVALSKEEQFQLKSVDTEKRIVCGAVLIPNKPIYRNQNGKEFNIVFPENTIRLASEAFLKNGHQKSSTLEHDIEAKLSGVSVVESWVKENDVNDKSVIYGFNDPIGTWYASMKIDNEEIWNDYVKTGKVKGFSIDGFFDFEQVNLKSNNSDLDFRNKMVAHHKMAIDMVNEYEGLLKDKTLLKIASDIIETQTVEINTMQKLNLKSELNMSEQKGVIETIVSAIKEGFASVKLNKETEVKLGSVNTADGSIKINFEGDTVMANLPVTMTSPDGTELPVPDGEYELEGGMKISVLGGVVAEVSTAQEEAKDEEEEMPMNDQANLATEALQVKSERVTQEVFYQLSKEEFNAMIVEFGKQVDEKVNALRLELTKQPEEVVELTKAKPAKEKTWAEMTPLERHRASKV